MNKTLKNDFQNLETILEQVKTHGLDFLNILEKTPVSIKNKTIKPEELPEQGQGTLETLNFFKTHYQKLIVSSTGPRYWGYIIGGVTPAALAGDWLCTIFDQNPQGSGAGGDVSAVLELETISLLRQLLLIDNDFSGGFVSGATLSNFTALAVARQWAAEQLNFDAAKQGVPSGITILAATPHSSVLKSLAMLGIGTNKLVRVKTIMPGSEAIAIDELEKLLEHYKGTPVILSASAGTVNTADFDELKAIAELKKKYNFWFHVDAAFGSFAACSPLYRHLLAGINSADSITVDCHKWMNVPYDSAVSFIKEKHKNLQIETFQNPNAPYLGDPKNNFNYINMLPENSRRFRALSAWFSLVAYGKEGFKDIVEGSIQMANLLGEFIKDSDQFELLAPVKLNTVCFTLANKPDKVTEFLRILNSRGNIFVTPTVFSGQHCIRASFSNWRTTENDIQIATKELIAVYDSCITASE